MARAYYPGFVQANTPPASVPAEATSFYAAVGAVAIAFSDLEDEVSLACGRLLGVADHFVDAVTSEMSFRNKLNLLLSLYQEHTETHGVLFGPEGSTSLDPLIELAGNCGEAEQMRNVILHSTYVLPAQADGTIKRRKITAKRDGVRVSEVFESPESLLRVAAFIQQTASDINLFFYNDARSP